MREIWTPESEVAELFADLDPRTEVDSMIRHFLHATIQQRGPVVIDLGITNVGALNWSIVHHEPRRGVQGKHEASIWVEDAN